MSLYKVEIKIKVRSWNYLRLQSGSITETLSVLRIANLNLSLVKFGFWMRPQY